VRRDCSAGRHYTDTGTGETAGNQTV
jgi:hypothetical protein